MIRKAVIPAAGYGTRFLPATKSQPKEMIPIIDTPVIQYVVEEAVASGITDILMIIGKGKRAIEEHFDRSPILEESLLKKQNLKMLDKIRSISNMANIHFIWQKEMNGLGDAILHAKYHVGNEPFVILLGDTVVRSNDGPITKQLIDVYEQHKSSVIALEEVKPELVHRYGIIDGKAIAKNVYKASDWIEKPSIEEAPSNLAVASRYIFTPEIFDFLEKTLPGKNDEIQLTDAMREMVKYHPMFGMKFKGKRYDIGNKMGFLKTNIEFGLKDPEIGESLKVWLKEFAKKL
ncbi:MAG: UTP--glucose-1-phosphate uridylyltransferase GalU [Prolixibacteraceae bacterium]|jgi:UTP--glucose-1-phosphate uridylyltransferase|nr:UTP--glucose-1-phosphate uridylyltransferase GalU [Prolixibacteraceae bacterium]MBT6763275.1 UTP--glucose-1-phosphate uridylyltransferase GalU [Prolixibacteraceae bacterium]MBT7000870.1 UTP--glucose-1-phosphate uridylyltransferase GalU [Prolixibacteraceae bacterium]MBT7396187.1 UTP--glucose-1-phosphate uridylyltransferase GalU [Prolixibacteraceae bacterium]